MEAPPPLTPDQLVRMHQNAGPTLIIVSSILTALAVLAVALRFVARKSRRVGFGADDWLSVGALIFVILFYVTCILTVPYGMGKHIWAANKLEAWKIVRIGFFGALTYKITHVLIKISILFFYRRTLTLNVTWFRYSVYALAFYTIGWGISTFFAGAFQCVPQAYFWEQFNPNIVPRPQGVCNINNNHLVIAASALNSAGDILIVALPIPLLWQLQLKKSHKIGVILVFATGAFACVAGIIRLSQTLVSVSPGADVTWITADIYLWTIVEAAVGLICACLPTIGPQFKLFKDRFASYLSQHSSRSALRKTSQSSGWMSEGNDSYKPTMRSEVSKVASTVETMPVNQSSIVRIDEFSLESHPKPSSSSSLDSWPKGNAI